MTEILIDATVMADSGLVVLDASRRSYLGLSRDHSYWHHIRPARPDDPSVVDGSFAAGRLICDCAGGRYGRTCYWTRTAERLESDLATAEQDTRWFDAEPHPLDGPAGAGEMIEASRG